MDNGDAGVVRWVIFKTSSKERERKKGKVKVKHRCSSVDMNVSPISVMLTKPTSKDEEEEVLLLLRHLVELVKVDFCKTVAQSLKYSASLSFASFLAQKMDKVEGACNGQYECSRPLTLKKIQVASLMDSIS